MNLEDTLSGISQIHKDKYCAIHVCEPERVQFIETENGTVVVRAGGEVFGE